MNIDAVGDKAAFICNCNLSHLEKNQTGDPSSKLFVKAIRFFKASGSTALISNNFSIFRELSV